MGVGLYIGAVRPERGGKVTLGPMAYGVCVCYEQGAPAALKSVDRSWYGDCVDEVSGHEEGIYTYERNFREE
jgi:hypothetical protein